MMGKVIKSGKSFKGCVSYCMLKEQATVLFANGVRSGNVEQTVADFNMQRKLRPTLGQAVGHIALNWSPNDAPKLTDEIMTAIAAEYLLKMKICDTQILMVRHHDREHPHLHIIYNRVNNAGNTISDAFQREMNVKVSKELTLKHGFHIGLGKDKVNRQQLKGADIIKYQLYDAIKSASMRVTNFNDLEKELAKQQIGVHYKYRSGSNEVQGISFSKDGIMLKGSKIDRSLSYGNLRARLEQQFEREQRIQKPDSKQFAPARGQNYNYEHQGRNQSLLEAMLQPQHITGPAHDMDDSIFYKKKKKRKGQQQGYSGPRR